MAFYARLDVSDPDNIVLLSSVQTLSGGEGWFEVVLTFELPFPDGKVPRVETHPTTGSYITVSYTHLTLPTSYSV